MSSGFLNDDTRMLYGMGDDGGADLMPMYSGLSSSDAIRQYQKQNNLDDYAEGLSWSERLRAGYTGIAHGVTTYGPEQVYRALRTMGKIFGSDDLVQFATEGVDRELAIRQADPFYQVPDDWMKDGWGRSLYTGLQGLTTSAYGMLPGAAVSLIPGFQGIGLGMLGAGAGFASGFAEYDSFMDDALAKLRQVNPGATTADIDDRIFWDAVWSGFSEGGTEAVTDWLGGKLIGMAGKAGVKPAKHVLDALIRNMTKTTFLEAGGEVTTAMIQDYLRQDAGLDYQGRVEAFKNALGPALIGGAAFGAGGTALHLAQGKTHALVNANRAADATMKLEGDLKSHLDKEAARLRQEFREKNYGKHALDAFAKAREAGMGDMAADLVLDAVENTAKAWAERTGNKVGDWLGDGGKLVDLFKRLEDKKGKPADMVIPESLDTLRDFLLSELNFDQRRALADAYKQGDAVDAEGHATRIDPAKFDADLMKLMDDPKHIKNIPEEIRPVMESMRDGLLDLHGLAGKVGMAGGFDQNLAGSILKAEGHRVANRPAPPPAITIDQAGMDAVLAEHGDFGKLSKDKQEAFFQAAGKTMNIDFDRWNLPADEKAMFALVDKGMQPMLNKLLGRGKRGDKLHEGLAKAALEKDGIDLDKFSRHVAAITGNGDFAESATVLARKLQIAEKMFLAKATDLGGIANTSRNPADVVKFYAASAMHQQTHAMLRAVRSEAGNLLSVFRHLGKDRDTYNYRVNQVYESMGGYAAAEAKLTALANAETLQERADILSDSLRAKTARMFMEHRTLNMLSSIKTQVANVSGNAMALTLETWNRFLAEHMGQGQGVVRGETFAFMGGMWDGLKKYLDTWRTDRAADPSSPLIGDAGITERALTRDNALDVIGGVKEKIGLSKEHGVISNGLSYMVEYMGRVLGLNGKLLQGQDNFFKTIAAHGELAARNFREAKRQSGGDGKMFKALLEKFNQDAPAAHKEAALDFAKFVTFQNNLTGYAKDFDTFRRKVAPAQALIPFFKTPVNLMKYAASHTPGLAFLFDDIRAQFNSPDLAVRHLAEARVMTGTMVWATAIGLAASGYLTGNGPVDRDEREKRRATGWQPNSLRIGDTYIGLDRLDPSAFLLNTAASFVEIVDSLDGEDLSKAMWGGLAAGIRVASNRTYLASVADAVAMVNDWEGQEGDRARQGFFTSLVPGSAMLRSVTQQVDPVFREVRSVYDALRATIPGASEALPERRNFLGEVQVSEGALGPDWLSPLRISTDKRDAVYDEISRLTSAGHKIPSMPDRTIRDKGRAIRLDGHQYSRFMQFIGEQKFGGKNQKEKLADIIASPAYAKWTDEQKAAQIQATMQAYRSEAKKAVFRNPSALEALIAP